MTEKERIQGEIKVLEAKLALLEEIENHKDQEVRKAYKDTYGNYPVLGMDMNDWDAITFQAFKSGYEAAQAKDAEVKKCPDKYVELPTLYEIIADWWDEIFVNNNEAGETIESLIDTIEEDWFFAEDEDEDRYAYGWNDCLEKLKLRLK